MPTLNQALVEKATIISNVIVGKLMDVQVGFSDFLYSQKSELTTAVYCQLSDSTLAPSTYVKLVKKYNERNDKQVDVVVYSTLLELMVFKEDHLYKPTE